jgi:hypothetical protein
MDVGSVVPYIRRYSTQVVRSTVELSRQVVSCNLGQIRSATNALSDLHTRRQPRFSFQEFSIISIDIETGPACHGSTHRVCVYFAVVHIMYMTMGICGAQLHRVSWASVGVVLFELNMVDRYAADRYD